MSLTPDARGGREREFKLSKFKNFVVLVSEGQFQRALFDERQLFGVEPDPAQSIMMGPVGDFSYASGEYKFAVAPDRIVVTHIGDVILSQELVGAATMIVDAIQSREKPQPVKGIGINLAACRT